MRTFWKYFTAFPAGLLFLAISVCASQSRVEMDLSGAGWKLWQDKDAKWESDELFLQPVEMAKLPVNPPTGGWDVLNSNALAVSVPGTVEEYFHPGNGPKGDIRGVSWGGAPVKIPGPIRRADSFCILTRCDYARKFL